MQPLLSQLMALLELGLHYCGCNNYQIHFWLPTISDKQSLTVPKLITLYECSDVTACQVTSYKQSTAPLLLQSCSTHVLHGGASSQLVIVNEFTRFWVAAHAAVSVHWIYNPLTTYSKHKKISFSLP